MSLRLRLFLGLSGLVAAMAAAQWWWVRGLTRDLSAEVGHVAFEVGHSLASVITHDPDHCPEGFTCEEEVGEDRILVRRVGAAVAVAAADEDEASPAPRRHVGVIVAPAGATPEDVVVKRLRTHGEGGVHWVDVGEGKGQPTTPTRVEIRLETATGKEREDAAATVAAEGHGGWFAKSWLFADDEPAAARFLTVASGDAGALRRIPIPTRGVGERLERFRRRLLWGSFAIFGAGLLLAAVVAHRVSTPLRRLSDAAREVGDGALGTQVAVTASGEVGRAIGAFNRMSSELAALDRKTRELGERQHLGEIGEISRGLAHTLRNPLNALGLSLEELAAQAPEEASGLAAAARRQIRRIDQSIRSFLALASQGGGVVSDVAPGVLVQDVALEALQDAGQRARLDVDVDAATPAVRAVEPELRAVLQALLVNAVEASPAGGTVTIRVRPAADAERVRIEIADDGPGLGAEVRRRLFTPHLTTKANGSGMGLFLAHRIATTRYGGRLELADRPAGGTLAVLEIGPRDRELEDE